MRPSALKQHNDTRNSIPRAMAQTLHPATPASLAPPSPITIDSDSGHDHLMSNRESLHVQSRFDFYFCFLLPCFNVICNSKIQNVKLTSFSVLSARLRPHPHLRRRGAGLGRTPKRFSTSPQPQSKSDSDSDFSPQESPQHPPTQSPARRQGPPPPQEASSKPRKGSR